MKTGQTHYARKNKDGKIISYLGAYHTPDGKRRTVSAKTKTECREKLRKAMSDADKGIIFDAKGQTVGAFLERWLEDVVRPNKTPRTYSTHKQQVRSHVVPAIGRVKLEALRKTHVDRLLRLPTEREAQRRGTCPGERAPRSRRPARST